MKLTMQNKNGILLYAKYLAVENGALTEAINDQLQNGSVDVAIQIMENRKQSLLQGKGNYLHQPSEKDIETMVQSIDEAIHSLKT